MNPNESKQQANQHYENGNYREAIKLYASYLAENPGDEEARQKLNSATELLNSAPKYAGSTNPTVSTEPQGGGINKVILALIVVVIIASAGFGYYYYSNFMKNDKKEVVDNDDNNKDKKDDKKNEDKSDDENTTDGTESDNPLIIKANDYLNDMNLARAMLCYKQVLEKEQKNKFAIDGKSKCKEIIKETKTLYPIKNDKGKYGLINDKGYLIVDYQFQQAMNMQNRLVPVKNNGMWGFVSIRGELLIKPKYKSVSKYSAGFRANRGANKTEHYIIENNGGIKIKALD